jgi:broad specificity phosphatase PhoE
MRLLLLRHGRTTATPGTMLGSRTDPGLSEQGRQEARAAGELLRGRAFAAVLCSPLLRARETAALAVPLAVPEIDARLQELDWGDITGLSFPQVEQRFPEVATAWLRDGWPSPPGGEQPHALWRRTAAAVLDIHRAHPEGDVLVVCHGGVIRSVVGAARGLRLADAWRIRTPYATLRVQPATPLALERWRAVLEVP